jgi:hypothetical protein
LSEAAIHRTGPDKSGLFLHSVARPAVSEAWIPQFKEIHMKRSVLLGLFVTASMMASTSFAADKPADLCDANVKTIENMKGQLSAKPELSQKADATLTRAHDLKSKGQIDNCVAETQQTILELQKATGTNN